MIIFFVRKGRPIGQPFNNFYYALFIRPFDVDVKLGFLG
jgi:hypothetical protein